MATLVLHGDEELSSLTDYHGRIPLELIDTVIKQSGKTTEVVYSPTTLKEYSLQGEEQE